jgi:2-polyprenyl-3-methyl-5-hydroxy-6-metoxy-1,4-benzoquinol methylase
MENAVKYFDHILREIRVKDPLHYKTLFKFMYHTNRGRYWSHLRNIIYQYFFQQNTSYSDVVDDYLLMIRNMRRETMGVSVMETNLVSEGKVQRNYMNALLLSQVLWEHHFNVLHQWHRLLTTYGKGGEGERVLDIGSGHGLFSKILMEDLPNINGIDIIDISRDSLECCKGMLGSDRVSYYNYDIENMTDQSNLYDIVIMGEVLEHLKDPLKALKTVNGLLSKDGVVWITVPTNSPAIDHLHIFKSEKEICSLIQWSDLRVFDSIVYSVEGSETKLVVVIAIKWND